MRDFIFLSFLILLACSTAAQTDSIAYKKQWTAFSLH